MEDNDLVTALLNADALLFGDFELSHGGTSEYYVDKYQFETDPRALQLIAERFAEKVDDEVLGGVALGGVPLATATSMAADIPYVVVRKKSKEYGTGNQIEGEFESGEEVVVVEDITTTGQSALDAAETLREAGASVGRILAVVDRQSGAEALLADHGLRLEPLLTADELLEKGSS